MTFDGKIGEPGDGLLSVFSPNNQGQIIVLNMTISQNGSKWTITGDYYMDGPGTNNVPNPHAGDVIKLDPGLNTPTLTAQQTVSDFGTIVINQP